MHTVILVDDHAMYREGIRSSMSKLTECPCEIIGEAGSAAEFFMFLQKGDIPDMALLDIMLPDLSGVEIARKLRLEYPEMKIIMLSSEVSEELITELLEIGVDGYLNKLARREDLQAALCTVAGGNPYFGRSVAKMMYEIYLAQQYQKDSPRKKGIFNYKKQISPAAPSESILSERETEIICLLCDGKSMKEIASRLCISIRTVETHKSNILAKLGFSNLVDLVKFAIKEGLVEI
ncbi:response regulator transcription factor [Petrimonas sulfuriphila]|jgi:DNA-binding NarL/FixJ family response regulator|uniref:response regulator transcription factor n=1 Tax=Petrimonas TaxID=307628 RepID=UPI002B364AF6|nr:response regulator transcription factor [Petrimonas sp.]